MVGVGVGWCGGVVCTVIFMSNPIAVLMLCCRCRCDNTGSKLWNIKLKLLQDLSYQEGEGGTMISLFVYGYWVDRVKFRSRFYPNSF